MALRLRSEEATHQVIILSGEREDHHVARAGTFLGRRVGLEERLADEARSPRRHLLVEEQAHLGHVIGRVHGGQLIEDLIVVLLCEDIGHPLGKTGDVEERWRTR